MARANIKELLGNLPLTAELYWYLRQTGKPPAGGYSMERFQEVLPDWRTQAEAVSRRQEPTRRALIFGMLPYWVEHTTITGLALAALGHEVTLAYLPYAHWKKAINRFDLRRQNLYMRDILGQLEPLLQVLPILDLNPAAKLPGELEDVLQRASFRDVQYSMLREEVEEEDELFDLRLERNRVFARSMLAWMRSNQPEAVIVPNGSILEFGMTYHVARYLDIPVMTYEFGEQSERIWMAQNADVMRQDTHDLWSTRKDVPLSEAEWDRVRELFASRQGGGLWENFARRWQGTPSQGGEQVKADLGLDSRPIVLLPTNVLGDSLTLGRQVFSASMTEWLVRTVQYFADHQTAQLVIRVHPGELLSWGTTIVELLSDPFPELPANVHLILADAQVNTYDLVDAADLGLVFSTTVGMEMAMIGLPVIVTGDTHYRKKGFTLDPESWADYYQILDQVIADAETHRPTRQQVELAWTYAYRFFFEYPKPFPWHVQHFWDDVARWPLSRALSPEGLAIFDQTFRYLVGEPVDWASPGSRI
jgi:hypothetical protein